MNSNTPKFKVGDRVKRINIGDEHSFYKKVKYGKVYTIRKVEILERPFHETICLKGFSNEIVMFARRFKLVESQTSTVTSYIIQELANNCFDGDGNKIWFDVGTSHRSGYFESVSCSTEEDARKKIKEIIEKKKADAVRWNCKFVPNKYRIKKETLTKEIINLDK